MINNNLTNIFKERSALITIIVAVFICTVLLFGLKKYMLPSFEEQIMLNVIDQAKSISNHLIKKYNKDNNFIHMEEMKKDLKLEKIKFFDKSGKILHSSDSMDIGQINKKDYFHEKVAKGEVFYLIVKKGKKTLENREVQVDVAEVYIPIMKGDKFQYAFEVYYDITNQVKRFDSLESKITTISYIIVIVTFLIVVIWQYYLLRTNQREKELEEKLHSSKKMVAMGEMIGNIAHQWRQPLSIISSSSTGMLMQSKLGVLKDEEFEKCCTLINDNAQYLSTTIDDFRKFIKGDRELKEFNISNNIESFLSIVTPSCKMDNVEIILNLDDSLHIKGYPNELIQCYMNIFNNAKDALHENKMDDKYIFIDTYKEKKHIIINFKDNAGGIDENVISRVFEPYYSTKHQSHGTGLGLSMTYSLIVEGMKGTIEAKNKIYEYEGKEYKGALFTIKIPVF